MGETYRVLFGLQNLNNNSIQVKNVTGALTSVKGLGDEIVYAQNFSIESFEDFHLSSKDSISIAFTFFPFTSLEPK